ncbi:alpha,alpha-trehalase nth1 [Coelomomyces lativittatus]|nr:alpha,alpha-trehalase nth1 [Coelomomyces lativittatus]
MPHPSSSPSLLPSINTSSSSSSEPSESSSSTSPLKSLNLSDCDTCLDVGPSQTSFLNTTTTGTSSSSTTSTLPSNDPTHPPLSTERNPPMARLDTLPYSQALPNTFSSNLPFSSESPSLCPENEPFLRRVRSLSTRPVIPTSHPPTPSYEETSFTTPAPRMRRSSHDELRAQRCFLIDVDETEKLILQQEDTDGDFQITVKDVGPKTMKLGSAASHGFHKYDIRGTYVLSNLLQELALAKEVGRQQIILHESKLTENPVTRLSRMIANHFWAGLTRSIDRKGLQLICQDPKNRSTDQTYKIYIPFHDAIAKDYFLQVSETTTWGLEVHILPPDITPEYVMTLDRHPGILSLGLKKTLDPATGTEMWRGVPFVVPGGRFNEMYGWDSYFEALGLLVDGQLELAKSMVDNFCYQIHYYGKILNANRTYYLTRSQPPFLTDMGLSVYQVMGDREWLARVLLFAIKEYYTVWTSAPRFHEGTGLSKYHTTGIGMPPETESTHFLHLLAPYAKKHQLSISEFTRLYNLRAIHEPELDLYFVHDRALRESGHDTTYRFEKKCADLLNVDLNSLLYKYEKDIAWMIQLLHSDVGEETSRFPVADAWVLSSLLRDFDPSTPWEKVEVTHLPSHFYAIQTDVTSIPVPLDTHMPCHWESAQLWLERAERRRLKMTELLWHDTMFFDYDLRHEQLATYESVTTLWALWAGLATPEQADVMVHHALPKFEMVGGLVSCTELSRGEITLDRPNRQWDYPFGWAPHQIMGWRALVQYGYHSIAQRLAYRWLYTITKAFVDYNGVVPEKFDVVTLNHILNVEYGNVGVDFKYVPREGFGWMNASYQIGLTYLNAGMKRQLGVVSPPHLVFATPKATFSPSLSPVAIHRDDPASSQETDVKDSSSSTHSI